MSQEAIARLLDRDGRRSAGIALAEQRFLANPHELCSLTFVQKLVKRLDQTTASPLLPSSSASNHHHDEHSVWFQKEVLGQLGTLDPRMYGATFRRPIETLELMDAQMQGEVEMFEAGEGDILKSKMPSCLRAHERADPEPRDETKLNKDLFAENSFYGDVAQNQPLVCLHHQELQLRYAVAHSRPLFPDEQAELVDEKIRV